MRARASREIVFSIRSTSPMYFGFKSANSASFSWVRYASFRKRLRAWASALRCETLAATMWQRSRTRHGRYTSYSWYFLLAFLSTHADCNPVNAQIEFRRRLGPRPQAEGAHCVGCDSCPDIWELESGDFAVIGLDITETAKPTLPQTAGCGPDERIVLLPRKLLVNAKRDIPDGL